MDTPHTTSRRQPLTGLVLGAAVGAALAVARDNVALGIAVGVLFAFAFGRRGEPRRA